MPYLVHCGTHECVESSIIVGIATNKKEIYELLYNLQLIKKNTFEDYTFEGDYDDICIFSITKDDYEYFKNYYKKIENKIEDNRKKYKYIINFDYNCKIEEQNTYFWHLFIKIDTTNNKLFNKEFIKKYNNIIENQTEIFV